MKSAFTNFFEGCAYPTFHREHSVQRATYTSNAFTLHGQSRTLAKQAAPLTIVWSHPLPENVKPSSVTLSKDTAGRYFISLVVEEDLLALPATDKAIGIDLGLKSFLITSDG